MVPRRTNMDIILWWLWYRKVRLVHAEHSLAGGGSQLPFTFTVSQNVFVPFITQQCPESEQSWALRTRKVKDTTHFSQQRGGQSVVNLGNRNIT